MRYIFDKKKRKIYKHYKKKLKSNVTDHIVQMDFSLNLHREIGKVKEFTMKSGKIGLYRLIDCTYNGVWDGYEDIKYDFVGYKDEKAIRDCTFNEFYEIYVQSK